MAAPPENPEWYYVGHYGQLGPLTLEQMKELARDGVIDQDTFVWKGGMTNWSAAKSIPDLVGAFGPSGPYIPPPVMGAGYPPPPDPYTPPPTPWVTPSPLSSSLMTPGASAGDYGYPVVPVAPTPYGSFQAPRSDKSRVIAGVLNLLPGAGRFYLGYAAHGMLQLLSSLCGIGYIWSVCDGIYILLGGVKYDGYGRRLED